VAQSDSGRAGIKLGLAQRVGHSSLTRLIKRFRVIGAQELNVADVGGARRNQTIENVASLVDVVDRDGDLILRCSRTVSLGYSSLASCRGVGSKSVRYECPFEQSPNQEASS
jgi:hypothetical protein